MLTGLDEEEFGTVAFDEEEPDEEELETGALQRCGEPGGIPPSYSGSVLPLQALQKGSMLGLFGTRAVS